MQASINTAVHLAPASFFRHFVFLRAAGCALRGISTEQVLVADITTSLRRLVDDITEDNWMYDPVDLGYSAGQQRR